MSKLKTLLTGAAITAAFALPAAAAQAAEIGQVCNLSDGYWVLDEPSPISGQALYSLSRGDGFRIEGFIGDYYSGHGNGRASGYLPRIYINQGSCHWE